MKTKDIIIVSKKGNIIPIKIFDNWWKCGEWCDQSIKKDKGFIPTEYEVNEVKRFKKYMYYLYLIIKSKIN